MEINLPKSKHELGYTKREVLDIIRKYKINHKRFWKKFGVNTCAIHPETNDILYYGCDIELTISCIIEKREPNLYEWD